MHRYHILKVKQRRQYLACKDLKKVDCKLHCFAGDIHLCPFQLYRRGGYALMKTIIMTSYCCTNPDCVSMRLCLHGPFQCGNSIFSLIYVCNMSLCITLLSVTHQIW